MCTEEQLVALGEQKNEYSPKIAQLLGLKTAVYAEILVDIYNKATKKQTLDPEGYCTLDRDYIRLQTTLTDEDQLNCDVTLEQMQIVERNFLDFNSVKVDKMKYISLLLGTDVQSMQDEAKQTKAAKEEKKTNKKVYQAIGVKKSIVESDPDVKAKLYELVDASFASKYKPLNKQSVKVFQDTINNFTQDKQAKIQIINIAISNGYTEPSWAINAFNRDYIRTGLYKQVQEQPTDSGLNKNVKF